MREPAALLDTNILSAVIAGRPEIADRGIEYLQFHDSRFTFSIITRYEILRGYRHAAPRSRYKPSRCSAETILCCL